MSNERRFKNHEIQQIFYLAEGEDDGPVKSLPSGDGLTLLDLQELGRDLGLAPDRITQAVAAFEGRGESVPRGTTLGLPTTVGRVVPLPRSPSDREWELLVTELRTTLGGKGEMTSQGGLREWSYRGFHAFIEPTETGHRLRFTDLNNAVVGIVFGGILLTLALLMLVVLLTQGELDFSRLNDIGEFAVPAFFALLGIGVAAGSAMALPNWAREREDSMEQIGKRALSLLALPASKDEGSEFVSENDAPLR